MKPTVKVSIGGYVFNLEEDAYQLVSDYLNKLKSHFSNKVEGEEIISDVESRMAELLQMKMQGKSEVITSEHASDVMRIMGNPRDFDDSTDEGSTKYSKEPDYEENVSFPRKKLYRDMDNRVLGGVCSGLGYYFKIDPVVFRLAFIGMAFFPVILHWIGMPDTFFNSPSTILLIVLLYIILWIVVPKAQTFKEKIRMTGKDPSISNIEEEGNITLRRNQPSILLKIIKVFFGIILGVISISLIISLVAILGAFFGFFSGGSYGNINDFLDIIGINSIDTKVALLLIIIIPIIALFDMSIKLLFRKRFTKGDLAAFLLGITVWIGAAFYFGGTAVNLARKYERMGKDSGIVTVETTSDTLYVKMPKEYGKAEPVLDEDLHIYKLKKDRMTSVFFVPEIRIKRDTTLTTYKVEFEKKAYDSSRNRAQNKVRNYKPKYEIKDSLLILSPQIYNKKRPWNREYYDVVVTVPANKAVEVYLPLDRK